MYSIHLNIYFTYKYLHIYTFSSRVIVTVLQNISKVKIAILCLPVINRSLRPLSHELVLTVTGKNYFARVTQQTMRASSRSRHESRFAPVRAYYNPRSQSRVRASVEYIIQRGFSLGIVLVVM